MIDWNNTDLPRPNKRVAIKLPDGRVCSGIVTETGGFNLEHVDNLDLLSYVASDEQNWVYLEE